MDLKIKLVDMKLPPPKPEPACEPSIVSEAPRYPWGLSVNLGNDELEKLGIAELPDVATEMILVGKVKVTDVSSRESANGGKHRSLALQITNMALDNGGGEAKPASEKLYKE